MNPFRIVGGSVSVFSVPLKTPFITAGSRKDATTNAGVTVRLAGGAEGYGEASGSVVYAHLRAPRLAALLRAELRRAAGRDARAWPVLAREVRFRLATAAPAAAFECALASAAARQQGLGLEESFGGALERIETDITLSAAGPVATRAAARRALADGFGILKIKVGKGYREDLERILTARRVMSARVILDGNQGMTPASALRLAEACLKRGVRVALFEQPLPRGRPRDCLWLQRRCPAPLAADEDVRSAQDALRLLDAGAYDVLNVKAAKTGLSESLDIVALARSAGKRLMIGCVQESSKGLEASAALALGTGAFSFVDLDSDHLLAPEQPRGRLRREGRWLSLLRP